MGVSVFCMDVCKWTPAVSYAEMTEEFGEDIFGGKQPKRAPKAVGEELTERG